MSLKQTITISVCAILLIGVISRAYTMTESVGGKAPSALLEDYVVVDETIANVHYRMANYTPLVEWFVSNARGLNDEEIEDLYEHLPLIGDVDNFDKLPPEKKSEYILEISKKIITEDPGYLKTWASFSKYSEGALKEVFAYYAPMFPETKLEIILVLNPFFRNGGMGVRQILADGQALGRLEIGAAMLAENPVTDENGVRAWIAHEMTHVIHQYFGAKGIDNEMDLTEIEDKLAGSGGVYMLGLFIEGLAVYASSLITGLDWANTDNYSTLMFYDSYSSGPVLEQGFVKTLAKLFLESTEEKGPADWELYSRWFSSKTAQELRPVPPYPAPGYFLGSFIIKTLIDEGWYTLEEIYTRPILDMMPDAYRTIQVLAK